MPHNSIAIPSLTLNKATGRGVVRLNGRDFYCGRFGTPECLDAYNALISKWLAGGRQPIDQQPEKQVEARPGPSVNEVCLAFLLHAEGYYKNLTGEQTSQLREYKLAVRAVRELFGKTPAAEFGPLSLKAVRQKMVDAKLTRAEVNRRVALVRRVFKWAASEELIPFETFHKLTTVAGLQKGRTEARDTEPVGPVNLADVAATLPFLKPQVRGLIDFMRLTGCRPGDAVLIRVCDIDQSGAVWLYRPHHHKNAHREKPRVIAIGPKAQEVLRPFFTDDPAAYLFSPRRAVDAHHAERSAARKTKRFPSHMTRNKVKRSKGVKRRPGLRYTTAGLSRAVARAIERANAKRQRDAGGGEFVPLAPWHPNQLRHTFATEVRKQYGLEHAGASLGHSRMSATEIYAVRDGELAAKVAAEMG